MERRESQGCLWVKVNRLEKRPSRFDRLTLPSGEARACAPTALSPNRRNPMRVIVDGMTCDHCVRTITKAIHAIDANARVQVDVADSSVTIQGDFDPAQATAAIDAEGYAVVMVLPDASKSCCGTCRAGTPR